MAAVDHIRIQARCPNDHTDAQWTETPFPTGAETAGVAILVVCAACGNDPARIEGR
jgi:hypothetical protein